MIYRRSLALRLEAEAASNAKSDFLAKMSHEIRTPINAMMGYAELMEMGISGPVSDQQAKQLGRIRASGEHLTSLVNEILDLAKIEAGRMAVEPTNASISDAIEGALALVRPQPRQGRRAAVDASKAMPNAYYFGDPQRVQQILTNLLSNAVKFTASGGHVTIRVESDMREMPGRGIASEWVLVSISDTASASPPRIVTASSIRSCRSSPDTPDRKAARGSVSTISRNLAAAHGRRADDGQYSWRRFDVHRLASACPVRALATN